MHSRFRQTLILLPGGAGSFALIGQTEALPGVRLPWRRRFPGQRASLRREQRRLLERSAALAVDPHTGGVRVLDAQGKPLGQEALALLLRVDLVGTRQVVARWVAAHGQAMEALVSLHRWAPAPGPPPGFQPRAFCEPRPPRASSWAWMFSGLAPPARQARARQGAAVRAWRDRRREHDMHEGVRQAHYQRARHGDAAALEAVLADCLRQRDWPWEMAISFELHGGGGMLALDVAVPEIAQFPYTVLSMSRRGIGVGVNWLTDAARRRLYRDHLHALGFRLVGEVFAALPGVSDVIFSAHTREVDGTTGQPRDDYLYSVRVSRAHWRTLAPGSPGDLDPAAALAVCAPRYRIGRSGLFDPIEPLSFPSNLRR